MSTPPLSYLQPLYLEQQSAGQTFPRSRYVMAGVPVLMVAVLLVLRLFIPYGIWLAFIPGLAIGAITTGIVALLVIFSAGTTIVEPSLIQLRLSVFGVSLWRRTIPVDQVQRVDLTDMTGQLSVLKLAVGELRFMTRKQCVRLHLSQYRYIVIGSADPEKLRDAVEQALVASRGAAHIASSK